MTSERPDVRASQRFTITESASLLGVSPRTIKRWIQSGQVRVLLPFGKDTKRLYISGYELQKAWANH